jgi:peptidoglycan/xylan/chitin deacetylase (PgdA/CDA1 family)
VCLTHDVDWIGCQEFARNIADAEQRCAVRSTFNFLTHWNYELDRALLEDLAREGFEIGLHGAEHDIALAYRSEGAIHKKLSRALAELAVPVKGFRSPALSSSESLFAVLQDLQFVYDSSLTSSDLGGLCFPFPHPGRDLLEIPLSLQDSMLFRDFGLGDDEGLEIAVETMETIVGLGGVFVFNGHPGILKNHMDFYCNFLDKASAFTVWKMEEVAASCQTSFETKNRSEACKG